MKLRDKPIQIGKVASVLALPLLLLITVASIPYALIASAVIKRRERKLVNTMKHCGRTLAWEEFAENLDGNSGTLIVERFSFKGPIRHWWTSDDIYCLCPYALADWLTMATDSAYDECRRWFSARYTGASGQALLIIASGEQWSSLRGARPFSFREGIRWIEIPQSLGS